MLTESLSGIGRKAGSQSLTGDGAAGYGRQMKRRAEDDVGQPVGLAYNITFKICRRNLALASALVV